MRRTIHWKKKNKLTKTKTGLKKRKGERGERKVIQDFRTKLDYSLSISLIYEADIKYPEYQQISRITRAVASDRPPSVCQLYYLQRFL